MPKKKKDNPAEDLGQAGAHGPHGCAPDSSPVALLLIDVINDFDFPEAPKLLRHAKPAARRIAALTKRLRAQGVPAIYVNDNFGRWRSDFTKVVERCVAPNAKGRDIAQLLRPGNNDYFVLKPKHSGFFSTSLEVLLQYLGARRLVLAGFAADICVLYTANDAYMRDYELVVPSDCIAAETEEAKRVACAQMKRFLRADVRPWKRAGIFALEPGERAAWCRAGLRGLSLEAR